jgi:hypothetical protein
MDFKYKLPGTKLNLVGSLKIEGDYSNSFNKVIKAYIKITDSHLELIIKPEIDYIASDLDTEKDYKIYIVKE